MIRLSTVFEEALQLSIIYPVEVAEFFAARCRGWVKGKNIGGVKKTELPLHYVVQRTSRRSSAKKPWPLSTASSYISGQYGTAMI